MCWGKKTKPPSGSDAGTNPPGCATAPCPNTTCKYQIIGPADVPGLSKYKYRIDVPAGKVPTGISWSADKATAGFDGGTDQVEATVTFDNSKPDWIKLKATFTLDGNPECAEKQVALVKVEVGAPTMTTPGKVAGTSPGSPKVFLVNPPAAPATATWVTTNDPGSNTAAFTYNGTQQAAEPRKRVESNGGGGGASFTLSATVKLTSPPEKPDAQQKIQVGYIQVLTETGTATYATAPAGKTRTLTTPRADALDWLSSVGGPSGGDLWPWYDTSVQQTGSGTGTWTTTLSMTDSPMLSIPAQYNPNNAGDANATKAIVSAAGQDAFVVRVAARTLDSDLGADKHFFEESRIDWAANYVWPVAAAVSIITHGAAWTTPGSATEIDVNIVPAVIDGNAPFQQWVP